MNIANGYVSQDMQFVIRLVIPTLLLPVNVEHTLAPFSSLQENWFLGLLVRFPQSLI